MKKTSFWSPLSQPKFYGFVIPCIAITAAILIAADLMYQSRHAVVDTSPATKADLIEHKDAVLQTRDTVSTNAN